MPGLALDSAPGYRTITITAHDVPGKTNTASMGFTCESSPPIYQSAVITSGQTVSYEVPEDAACQASVTDGHGRFGPLFEGEFVVDYSRSWPDLALGDPGDDWHLWVGADSTHPVYWVIADKSAGSVAERPALLTCGPTPERWEGNVEYGAIVRIVRNSTSSRTHTASKCSWTFDAVPGFDGTQVETFGPIISADPNLVFVGDSSTLSIVTDYYEHPDNGPEAFLNAVNRRANGRKSTAGELNWWIPRLGDDPGFRGLAIDAIVQGEEYQARTEPIARLYQAYFDRLPDGDGIAYWADLAGKGMGLLEISSYFAQSDEFQQRYGNADNAQFVLLAYSNVLAREPDNDGYDYWLDLMQVEGLNGPGVLFYFSDSNEFRTSMRERLAISGTYTLVLNRAPTESEIVSGIDSLRATGSLALLANTLLESSEYAASFARYL